MIYTTPTSELIGRDMETVSLVIMIGLSALLSITIAGIAIAITKNIGANQHNEKILNQA
jgi:hypothetical protein